VVIIPFVGPIVNRIFI